MKVAEKDRDVLRKLGEKVAKIAALPVHNEKINMWKKLNSLKKVKPMIWINEEPWHEMDVNDELKLQTSCDFCRSYELNLRMIIYKWEHMPVDMVVEPIIECPIVFKDTGFGINEEVDVVKTDDKSSVVSRHYYKQIESEKDIERIKMPVIKVDDNKTKGNYQITKDIFDGILKVQKTGIKMYWFAPWDELVRWWDPQTALMDIALRPELVHMAMDRLVNAYLYKLEQYEKLGLLSLNNNNCRIGSGALGYIEELPKKNFNSSSVRTIDQWGCATAQIFSEVSPAMHEEFALNYELRWLKKFGLNYYGCCEPLHNKIDLLKKIPNLRKISISPKANLETAVKNIKNDYVISYKPNPSIFVGKWDIENIRKEFRTNMEKLKGCRVEVIMKDISTVEYKPQHLWEWAKIVSEVTQEFG